MIVNPVPWIQSCALWTYRTGWLRIKFIFSSLVRQTYYIFYYEMLSNGIKLSWSCVPGECAARDSGTDPIRTILCSLPTADITLYSGLDISGWGGIQWQQIFINQVVTT